MRACRLLPKRWVQAIVGLFLFAGAFSADASSPPAWSASPPPPRGSFPNPRPGHATYLLSWSGLVAGSAEVDFNGGEGDTVILQGRGRSVGLARALWRFDVDYRSVVDATTLRPQQTRQEENTRGKRVVTELKFNPDGVVRTRREADRPTSTKDFASPNLFDLYSALLYVRSQTLNDRDVCRLAVYSSTAAYLASLKVTGHEELQGKTGLHAAIKLDLKLQRIGKKDLEPYRKLKRATIWVSDDNDRLPLKIEGQIFVGAITAELQSTRFE